MGTNDFATISNGRSRSARPPSPDATTSFLAKLRDGKTTVEITAGMAYGRGRGPRNPFLSIDIDPRNPAKRVKYTISSDQYVCFVQTSRGAKKLLDDADWNPKSSQSSRRAFPVTDGEVIRSVVEANTDEIKRQLSLPGNRLKFTDEQFGVLRDFLKNEFGVQIAAKVVSREVPLP